MRTRRKSFRGRRQAASAVLVVFMLLAVLSAVVAVNALSLRRLKEEIQLIERKQLKKFELPPTGVPGPAGETNRLGAAAGPGR